MSKSIFKANWMPGLLITLVCLLLTQTTPLQSLDWHAYDLAMRLSGDKPASDDIVVIVIDDQSINALGPWPWSHALLAKVTAIVSASRPRVFGLMLATDAEQAANSLDAISELSITLKKQGVLKGRVRRAVENTTARLDVDQQLASTLGGSVKVVLAMPYLAGSIADDAAPVTGYLQKFSLSGWTSASIPQARAIYPPIELLSKSVGGIGFVNAEVETDSHSHLYPQVIRYDNSYFASFELMMAARHLNLSADDIRSAGLTGIEFGNKNLVTDSDFAIYPYFYPAENDQPTFRSISAVDLLNNKVPASALSDKTVILGLSSERFVSAQHMPNGAVMPPVLVAAHSLSSILNNHLYQRPIWADLAQAMSIGLTGLYLMFLLTRLRKTTGLFLSVFILLILINIQLIFMTSQSIWIPLIAAILALITGHLVVSGRQFLASHSLTIGQSLSEANRQLGQSFQSQGQLDQAFEQFKLCDTDDRLLGQLYNLGLDYERKRQFNKAISVFGFIQGKQPDYSDVSDRIHQNKKATEAVLLGSGASANTHAALILDNGDMQKPMLGRYQIEKEIGRGAMGMVYLGRDEKIGRTVAIKTMAMREEIEPNKREEVKARFFREAEAAGRLNHPNIVTVYDVGEQDLAYIAMDYLKGKDLTAYCEAKTLLPIETVFEIIISVAKALAYAHEQHVVHRDIKPANIIYHPAKKIAKLTDFGVACLTDASKTKTGTVLGSPYYMSPEQLAGSKVDGRADIYSLGVTLYQLIAGELPFTSDSMANLMYRIANEKHADIRHYRPDVPGCVGNIISRCLQKNADKRYQSGDLMATAMKRCLTRIREQN